MLRKGEEEKDILYNEKMKLLKDILDLNLLHVISCKELNEVKTSCSEMKGNLQIYAVKYTTMEVTLYESQFKYNSENNRSSKNILMGSPTSSSKGGSPSIMVKIFTYLCLYVTYIHIHVYVYVCIYRLMPSPAS